MTRRGLILKIDCPDRPGLVAKIAGFSLHAGTVCEIAISRPIQTVTMA